MLVIVDKTGQLGNRLFVFAHCIATSAEEGFRVSNLAFDEFADWFPATQEDLFCRYPTSNTRWRSRRARRGLYLLVRAVTAVLVAFRLTATRWWRVERVGWDERFSLANVADAARDRILVVQGWLIRNSEAFDLHSESIRRFFTPSAAIQERVEGSMREARRQGEVIVGLHIRRADYRSHLDGRFFYDWAVYLGIMDSVRELFSDRQVAFLLASDEPVLASRFDRHVVAFAPGDTCGDLYALARCDYLVGPPSSFSLWASFMGKVPLYQVVDPQASFDLSSFRVAPEVADPEMGRLYGFDV